MNRRNFLALSGAPFVQGSQRPKTVVRPTVAREKPSRFVWRGFEFNFTRLGSGALLVEKLNRHDETVVINFEMSEQDKTPR